MSDGSDDGEPLLSDEEAKAVIMGIARARPDGFTEAEAKRVLEDYEQALVACSLYRLVVLGELDCKWDDDAGETTFTRNAEAKAKRPRKRAT